MLRVRNGSEFLLVQHDHGDVALAVYDALGNEETFEITGVYGGELDTGPSGPFIGLVGDPFPLDGLHGGDVDRDRGIVHRGQRHATLDDGRWLQPEPLLYLGPGRVPLEMPQAFGPVYGSGNPVIFEDRSGFFLPLMAVAALAGGDASAMAVLGYCAQAVVAGAATGAMVSAVLNSPPSDDRMVGTAGGGFVLDEVVAGAGTGTASSVVAGTGAVLAMSTGEGDALGTSGTSEGSGSGKDVDLDELAEAGKAIDKGRHTKAGRALAKHAGRPGSTFKMPERTDPESVNEAGQEALEDILTDPESAITELGRGGLEIRKPNGAGVRYNPDGTMSGFVD